MNIRGYYCHHHHHHHHHHLIIRRMDRGIFDSIKAYSDDIQNYIDALLETMKITNCILYLKQGIHFYGKKINKKSQHSIT